MLLLWRASLFLGVLFALLDLSSCLKISRRGLLKTTTLPLLSPVLSPAFVDASPAFVDATPAQPEIYRKAAAFYDAWNEKDVDQAMTFFSSDVVLIDSQYDKPFVGAQAVRDYLQECVDSLPGWKFIIDDHAADIPHNTLGLRWHVEDSSHIPLPFPNNGISFLTFNDSGDIREVRDMVEPTVKTGLFQLPLLRAVSKILNIH